VRTVDGNRNSSTIAYALVNKNLAFSFGGYTAPLLDTTVTDALGHATQTLSGAMGRMLFTVDAEARQSTFEYDANGSLTQFRDPNATGYDCVYDDRNRKLSCTDRRNATTSQAYDAQSNVITMTDGLNHSSHCVYDARNRKSSCTDRINGVTNYTYDANSNLATISDADAVAGNTGKQTLYTYDPRNLLATETYPDNGVKSFVYDGANRLVSRLDQKNDTVSYLYDFANRMTSRHYPDGQDDTFTFDAASRLLTAASARYNNVVTRTYDPASRLLSETQHINGVDYPVAYGYDAANRQTSVTYPDGKVLSRTFTNRDQLATATFDGGNVLTRTYDIGMRQDQTTYGNSIVESRRYQNDNLIAQINTTGNQVKLVYDLGDGYDANKRNTFAADFNLGVYEYAYDNEDRLTSNFDQGVGVTQTWVLSLVGDWNSFTKNAVTETRTHDAAHELLTRNATSLTYDQKGNLTQHSNGQQYTWDYENRMQTAVNALAVQVGVYTYDALGRRASKVTTAGITVFVSDGLQEIAEYDNAAAVNAPTREYVFGNDYIDEPVMMLTGGARYYYHADRMSSVQALTNAAGQIVERYRYDAYGNTTVIAPNGTIRAASIVGNPWTYTGRRLDAETGLMYFRTRQYDPVLGRFLNRNFWGYVHSFPTLYDYVSNRPTQYVEPLSWEAIKAGAGAMWGAGSSLVVGTFNAGLNGTGSVAYMLTGNPRFRKYDNAAADMGEGMINLVTHPIDSTGDALNAAADKYSAGDSFGAGKDFGGEAMGRYMLGRTAFSGAKGLVKLTQGKLCPVNEAPSEKAPTPAPETPKIADTWKTFEGEDGKSSLVTRLTPNGELNLNAAAEPGAQTPAWQLVKQATAYWGNAVKSIRGNWTAGDNLAAVNEITE
jgi:RHS repeat-associated protein